MRPGILLVITLAALWASAGCESDDICEQAGQESGAKLGFFNLPPHDTLKPVSPLYAWAEGKDTLYAGQVDSIVLPLDFRNAHTRYFLSDSTNVDTVDIYYRGRETFVSPACGYTYYYSLDSVQATLHWIHSIEITEPDTGNEDFHLRIYH